MEARLRAVVGEPSWILEGGPSLLPIALARAEVLVWLDPPTLLRARRLARLPWFALGRTRPELPMGKPDRLGQQYRFGLRSLAQSSAFRTAVAAQADTASGIRRLHCRTRAETRLALAACAVRA